MISCFCRVVTGSPVKVAKYITEACAKYPRVVSVSIQERPSMCSHEEPETTVYFVVEENFVEADLRLGSPHLAAVAEAERSKWSVTTEKIGPTWVTRFNTGVQHFTLAEASEENDDEAEHYCKMMALMFRKAMSVVTGVPDDVEPELQALRTKLATR